MQTFLKLLAVLFILVPKCTASSSLPKEILNYTELLEDQIRNVNLDEELNSTKAYIAPVENQLRQCGEMEEKIMLLELQINETNKANQQLDEYKNQIEKQGAEIKSISIKDELIASQKAEIEDKLILLEMQINKTNKANEQIEDYKNQIQKKEREIENLSNNNGIVASQRAEIEDKTKLLEDYQLQIAKKELEIKNLQSNLKKPKIICPHDMVKSYEENKMLKSEVQNLNDKIQQLENEQNEENKMLKSEVQNLNDKIQQLKNEKNECELTIKNLDQLNDELGDQEESCQMDLESERFDSNEKDVTIDDMKKEAEANRKLLDQCQENNMNLQKTEEEKKSVEEKLNECQLNNTNLVKLRDECFKEYQSNQQIILESCQNDLESQRNETTYKNVTIKELNKVVELNHNGWTQCQKNMEEVQTKLFTLVVSCDTKYANINNLVDTCKEQLESQRIETTYKNATINELNDALDEYKKNNADLNNRLSAIKQCAEQCNGNNFFKKTWCKAKCKLHC